MSLLSTGLKKLGSNLKSVGDIATRAAPVIAGGLAGGPIGVIATGLGVISKIAPSTSPIRVPVPALPVPAGSGGGYPGTTMALAPSGGGGGVLAPIISGAVSGLIDRYAPGGGGGGSSCGCNGSRGRDPCTHQLTAHKKAPLATFFGGCCPPGRVLRRKPMGRDVCIRTPRMNPFNPRALARADRRITTFARRAAPLMRDLGFDVSRHRAAPRGVKVGKGRRKRGGR